MSHRQFAVVEKLEARALCAAPIIITKGGTYTGTWESTDPNIPAVRIQTSQPVVILNSTIRAKNDLIAAYADHVKLTVKNTKGFGLNPNVKGRSPGRFVYLEDFDSVVIQGNQLENTGGIYLQNYAGNRTAAQTIKIVNNRAHNIDGRKSNGAGGWYGYNVRKSIVDGHVERGYNEAQFVQLNKVKALGGIEIGWNQVVNDPLNSRVEDVISIYNSSGTSASPIRIHDNFINGAYTIKPMQASYTAAPWAYDWSFAGGGIMLGDGVGKTAADDSAHVKAYNNTIVNTTNHALALASGHHLEAYNNRALSPGVLADGTKIAAQQNAGVYVWDFYKLGATRFHHNTAHHNVGGWMTLTGRKDFWSPVAGALYSNTSYGGTLTWSLATTELATWKTKLASVKFV